MKFLDFIYRFALSFFELIIDLLILFLVILVIQSLTENYLIENIISIFVIFCGLIYAIQDFRETYDENKLKK